MDFADKENLRKVGGNRFTYLGSSQPTSARAEARVANGCLEGSGADAIKEMVALIEAGRAYELNIRMIQAQDATLGRVVNDVGAMPG